MDERRNECLEVVGWRTRWVAVADGRMGLSVLTLETQGCAVGWAI